MSARKDLVGQVFGRWTVIRRGESRFVKTQPYTYWLCKCQCGVEKEVITQRLIYGDSKSCGCYAREQTSLRNTKEGSAFRIVRLQYKRGAKKRNLDFCLSDTQFRLLTTERCYYCGQAPTAICTTKGAIKEEFKHSGIDRLNPDIGYIMDNCVPCCSQCNYMKQDFSEEEFISKCKEIAARHTC